MIEDNLGKELAENGFPYCPICGRPLQWESDYPPEDLDLTTGNQDEDSSIVINVVSCRDCDKSYEIMYDDGQYHLLTQINESCDEEDEDRVEYTEYAKNKFIF